MHEILVLDANERSALAVTRSLGRLGHRVIAADTGSASLAGASRFATRRLAYPDPYSSPSAFIDFVLAMVDKGEADVIIPCTEVTTYLLCQASQQLQSVHHYLPTFPAFEELSDKGRLFHRASHANLTIPETVWMEPGSDPLSDARNLGFPVVMKPYRSRILDSDGWLTTSVKVADSEKSLTRILQQSESFRRFPWLLQQFIPGTGAGVFSFHVPGQETRYFSHTRIRERPPGGGVSVLSESAPVPEDMVGIATRLLDVEGWRGPAMVEFRVDPHGTAYLMEINPRLWGSLQLAVDAGFDVPRMLLEGAVRGTPECTGEYEPGHRLRWLLGDLDRLYMVFRSKNHTLNEKARDALQFLNPGWPRTRYEVNRLGDLGPFWHELRHYLG